MQKHTPVVGLIGTAETTQKEALDAAYKIGKFIGRKGWILLNGGRNSGVMQESSRGASEENGMVIGILPGVDQASPYLTVPIYSGMGSARNNIIVLSADILVAVGDGLGTTSEISLGLKSHKPVIFFRPKQELTRLFQMLDKNELIEVADSVEDCTSKIENILKL